MSTRGRGEPVRGCNDAVWCATVYYDIMTRERAPELPQRRRKVSRRLICASEIKRGLCASGDFNLGTQLPFDRARSCPPKYSGQSVYTAGGSEGAFFTRDRVRSLNENQDGARGNE